jgi:hypothetical protein
MNVVSGHEHWDFVPRIDNRLSTTPIFRHFVHTLWQREHADPSRGKEENGHQADSQQASGEEYSAVLLYEGRSVEEKEYCRINEDMISMIEGAQRRYINHSSLFQPSCPSV